LKIKHITLAKESIALETKKNKRLREWEAWINDYLEFNPIIQDEGFHAIPNAALLLNDYYWRLAMDYLKPLLNENENGEVSNIHYYKIISASELTVMAVLPFTSYKEEVDRKVVNAEFAWYVGISIMVNWKIQDENTIEYEPLEKVFTFQEAMDVTDNGGSKLYPNNFRDEHIEWLKGVNPAAPLPIISNSHVWRLLYIASKLPVKLK
jgi:hypothetical protein